MKTYEPRQVSPMDGYNLYEAHPFMMAARYANMYGAPPMMDDAVRVYNRIYCIAFQFLVLLAAAYFVTGGSACLNLKAADAEFFPFFV